MDNIWLVILKEALDGLVARTDEPVAGAKLRAAVKQVASNQGLQFPPPEGLGKWSAFLESFPEDIIVIPNPGSDVLVVPASRLDLKTKADALVAARPASSSPPKRARLRSDIFEALTRIPSAGERPVYLPETDAVLWQNVQEVAPPNAVPFHEASLEGEVNMRQQFIAKRDGLSAMAKEALEAALKSDGPLRQFTHAIRSFGLLHDWHQFRMAALLEQLRGWAATYALTFRDDWLGSDEPREGAAPAAALAAAAGGNRRGLVELAGRLTDDDISRISVPLDVVLRLLTSR